MLSSTRTGAAALLLAATLAACGGGDPTVQAGAVPDNDAAEAAEAAEAAIDITDFLFQPEELSISAGTTVTFTNNDRFGHTATAGTPGDATGSFDVVLGETSDSDTTGMTGTHAFDETGTFQYFCRYHPSMTGTIVVS